MKIKQHETLKILLIEDDVFDREQIIRNLNKTELKYEITGVMNVEQGIDYVKKYNYNIILLDYHLPGKNGIELLKHLKKYTNSKQVAVIIVSLIDDEDIIFECLRLGAQDFISKESISPLVLKRAVLNAQIKANLIYSLKQSNSQLKQLAENDSLTGLSNRYYFYKCLSEYFKKPDHTSEFSLILLNIDNFKTVNDLYGHSIGDELLKEFASIMKNTLPDNVLFARIDGDEFAIFLDSKINTPQLICETLYEALESYVCIGEEYHKISMSIGYASTPKDTAKKTKLFQFADFALYYSKNNKTNKHFAFSSSMNKARKDCIELKTMIKQAYENNQFSIHFQPIINASNESLRGFEALLRLKIEAVNYPPDTFIKVLEQMKLIHNLGYWLIDEVLKQQSKWIEMTGSDINMSINLSPVQLNNEKIIEFIFEKIKKYKIKPNLLMFELTETVLLENPAKIRLILKRIREFGCRIALDDFGTGFSSLSHLKEFPINTVKIDKSMIPEHINDSKSINIIRGLVVMLNSLDLDIVAEGIETDYQLKFCKSLKIHSFQGYIYDKPMQSFAIEQKYFTKMLATKVL